MTDLGYLLALVRFPKFGPLRLARLRGFFESMEATFGASRESLLTAGIEPKIVEQFLAARPQLSPEKELFLLEKNCVQAVAFTDPEYPPLLKNIYDPPAVLFVRGRLPSADNLYLSVVGSRKPTAYGLRAVSTLVEPLAAAGIIIVSGLAYGIDTLAHEAALKTSGTTVAVLGSSVDEPNIFPSANCGLTKRIIENNGAVISEFPIGSAPMKQNFPIRNRVIAGLCHGTLIVEATKTSGSLITARAALEDGREIFAVPGPISYKNSEGANQLIKTGAHLVTEANDILSILGLTCHSPSPVTARRDIRDIREIEAGSREEAEILNLLSLEPIHIDDLARTTGKKIPEISHMLTLMEMKGSARHVGGLFYTS